MGVATIRIEALELEARIGVFEEERARPQPLVLELELDVELDDVRIAAADDLADTLDYAGLRETVLSVFADVEHKLIETAALRVVEVCLADARVARAAVRIAKPNALPGLAVASVRVERGR